MYLITKEVKDYYNGNSMIFLKKPEDIRLYNIYILDYTDRIKILKLNVISVQFLQKFLCHSSELEIYLRANMEPQKNQQNPKQS